jgi:hypothetical protein
MKHFKFSYVLITLAALAQGVMWVNVFKLLHPGILAYIGGVPAGLAIVGLVARSATVLPRVTSKRARTAGWVFLGLLVVTEPIVLGFANWQAIYPRFQSLAVSYVVSGGASLTISIALILGAIVDRSLVPVEKPVEPKQKKQPAKTAEQIPQGTTQATEPTKVYSCSWPGCEWTTEQSEKVQKGGNPVAALAAHTSHHNRAVRKIEAEKAQEAQR